jgi:T5orf172 domain-containing protein
MTFATLSDFIANRMHMQNVYQPVALRVLLESEAGVAHRNALADSFRLEAEEPIHGFNVREYPGKVLANHEVIEVLEGGAFRLVGFEDLSEVERHRLIELCEARLSTFLLTQLPTSREGQDLGRGRVYVLRNPAMPCLIKVGFTSRVTEARTADLNRSGGTWLPAPFEVAYESPLMDDAYKLEQSILTEFEYARFSPKREFLDISVQGGGDGPDRRSRSGGPWVTHGRRRTG